MLNPTLLDQSRTPSRAVTQDSKLKPVLSPENFRHRVVAEARELPALYEVRDGQPSLVNFQVQDGTYIVPKVLDRGYLALGNQRFSFEQRR